MLAEATDENARRSIETRIAQIPYPETMPLYSDLRVDATGNLWVGRYAPPGHVGPRQWAVLGTDGSQIGTATFPSGFQVHEIGKEAVLGVMTDHDTRIETVQVRRLRTM